VRAMGISRRVFRSFARVTAVAVLMTAGASAPAFAPWLGSRAFADETTVSVDTLRTGWDTNEPGLAPAQVTSSSFGQLFSTAVDGQVYGQPIVVGSTVIVATENNKAYGLDATTGAVKWSVNFGPAWPTSAIGCGDLTPSVGSTATPTYDPSTGTVYFTAKVNDGPDVQHPHWYMHALDASTGAERPGWPTIIQGAAPNNPTHPFDPFSQLPRPGLLLMGGSVYAAFGSLCDLNAGNYEGFVAGVNTTTRALSMWVDESGPSSQAAGIWQGGGGLVSDGPGRIFFASGNGIAPPVGPGTPVPGLLGESVVRLAVAPDGSMSAQDFFSPANAPMLNTNDQDLGSGGPVGLPDSFGTAAYPHLMVQVGKDGRVFLLNRDNLGGRGQGSGGGDAALGIIGPIEGVWGHPGVWGGDGGYVYLVGSGGPLRALKIGSTGTGVPAFSLAGNSSVSFPYTSGSPIVTSTGTTSGSALVWVIQASGPTGTNGQLMAFSAVPVNGTLPFGRSR
jgi:PQQ-like domain